MSEKRMKMRQRRQGFRRLHGEKKAVSPVVATLILILIAVAAAAALYLWLVAWQGGVTKGIGSPGAQYTLSIGGSTTVYPLDQVAIPWFEQNNSDVVVSNQPGGSGSGTIAVCAGAIDIGASSSVWTSTQLLGDGCPSGHTYQTPIAYDGVDMIQAASNGHGILSLNATDVFAIYYCNGLGTSYNAGASSTYTVPAYLDNHAVYSSNPNSCPSTASHGNYDYFDWNSIYTQAGCGGVNACALGTGAVAISIYHRADNAGTEQSFVSLLMGTSCGTDKGNELAECGITNVTGETGNVNLLAGVVANANALGFNSNGIVDSTYGSSAANYKLNFQGTGQAYGGVAPTPTTVLAGVAANCGASPQPVCKATQYFGWRQLEYVTVNAPTGEAQRFIQFVTGSSVNQDLCALTGYISIYAPGAPPPTPIVL